MNKETTEQDKNPRNRTGKGGFGDHPENRNDGGRVPNPLKAFQQKQFIDMTDDQKKEYLETIPPLERWKMAEGNPHSTTDETVEVIIPKPIYDGLSRHNSNKKDIQPDQKD